jgi:predicted RNA binding protein with dsRBD fold (UPF0201 family)
MTQDQTTLFETAISNIHNSLSSIFAKEDVIHLLTTMQSQFQSLPEAQPGSFTKQYILDTLEEALNEFDYDEFTTFDPELQGAYGSSWSLEINHSFDDREFKRGLLTVLEDYLTPTE